MLTARPCYLCPVKEQVEPTKLIDKINPPEATCALECVGPDGDIAGCGRCPLIKRRLPEEADRHSRRILVAEGNDSLDESDIDVVAIVAQTGGDPEGTFSKQKGMLSEEQMDSLKTFVDMKHESDQSDKDDYYTKVPATKLVELLGPQATTNLVKFFYEAVGYDMPISSIQIGRTYRIGFKDYIPFHTSSQYEDRTTLLVPLSNGDESEGAELVFLNRHGVQDAGSTPGDAMVFGPNVIHGVKPHEGIRYTFFLVGKPNAPCVFKDVL